MNFIEEFIEDVADLLHPDGGLFVRAGQQSWLIFSIAIRLPNSPAWRPHASLTAKTEDRNPGKGFPDFSEMLDFVGIKEQGEK